MSYEYIRQRAALGGECDLVKAGAVGIRSQDSWILFPDLGGEWGLVVKAGSQDT